jgi:hypothetical protein
MLVVVLYVVKVCVLKAHQLQTIWAYDALLHTGPTGRTLEQQNEVFGRNVSRIYEDLDPIQPSND